MVFVSEWSILSRSSDLLLIRLAISVRQFGCLFWRVDEYLGLRSGTPLLGL